MRHARKLLAIDFVRFCLVGTAGFFINFALLTLFYRYLELPIFLSQLLASEVALFHNFALHHNWTYRKYRKPKSITRYIVEFHATSWTAIIGSALLVSLAVSLLHFNYVLALMVSSAIALLWNFLWTKYFIWSGKPGEDTAND